MEFSLDLEFFILCFSSLFALINPIGNVPIFITITENYNQQERNKIHLIGRIYRTILEPICYWAGKK